MRILFNHFLQRETFEDVIDTDMLLCNTKLQSHKTIAQPIVLIAMLFYKNCFTSIFSPIISFLFQIGCLINSAIITKPVNISEWQFLLADVIICVKKGSVDVYCNPLNYYFLLPYISHWHNLRLHCLRESDVSGFFSVSLVQRMKLKMTRLSLKLQMSYNL